VNRQRLWGSVDGLQGKRIIRLAQSDEARPKPAHRIEFAVQIAIGRKLEVGLLLRMISGKASTTAGTRPWRSTRPLKRTGSIPSQRISRTTSPCARDQTIPAAPTMSRLLPDPAFGTIDEAANIGPMHSPEDHREDRKEQGFT
jgi:hypothetical protein